MIIRGAIWSAKQVGYLIGSIAPAIATLICGIFTLVCCLFAGREKDDGTQN